MTDRISIHGMRQLAQRRESGVIMKPQTLLALIEAVEAAHDFFQTVPLYSMDLTPGERAVRAKLGSLFARFDFGEEV